MASEAHLEVLRAGRHVWNEWRDGSADEPDLENADLTGLDLSEYNFSFANVSGAKFSNAVLSHSDFDTTEIHGAEFRNANLWGARLENVFFYDTDFSDSLLRNVSFDYSEFNDVTFAGADLERARFHHSKFSHVSLVGADLLDVLFRDVVLEDVDFSFAQLGGTVFAATRLNATVGLEQVRHVSPSSIGIDTFFNSGGLPDTLLRGVGSAEDFVLYADALAGQPIEFYSCFLSYASPDEEFARRLYRDLQARRVRTWFAPENLKIGDRLRPRIDLSIRVHDKLVLVLSNAAVKSTWVEKEVETAFARERREKKDILFPIRLDDAVFETEEAWAADIANMRHIGDFRDWTNHQAYVKALDGLVRDLKKDGPTVMR
jgi:hypothetical protein